MRRRTSSRSHLSEQMRTNANILLPSNSPRRGRSLLSPPSPSAPYPEIRGNFPSPILNPEKSTNPKERLTHNDFRKNTNPKRTRNQTRNKPATNPPTSPCAKADTAELVPSDRKKLHIRVPIIRKIAHSTCNLHLFCTPPLPARHSPQANSPYQSKTFSPLHIPSNLT
jgi:hypothetical protein